MKQFQRMVLGMTIAVGIDVSKATSNVAIVDDGTITWEDKITNDQIGFATLLSKLKAYQSPQIVFEATGVYSRRIQRFLQDNGYPYVQLNPLTAKKQLDSLRPNKTDRNDALNLAITQLTFKREPSYQQDPVYQELNVLSRFYDNTNTDLVAHKNRLHKMLQLVFPEIEHVMKTTDSPSYWRIVKRFSHPDQVLAISVSELAQNLTVLNSLSATHAQVLAEHLHELAVTSYPAVTVDSMAVWEVSDLAGDIFYLDKKKQIIIEKMSALSDKLSEFTSLTSIPGIGAVSANLLIAELGDIRRFKSSNQLNAYIGIDLRHYESGNFVADDRISKRGNKWSRKILYHDIWTIKTASRTNPNHIADFYDQRKKQSSQKGSKKIAIAAMHRLVRTMHHLVKYNETYNYAYAHHKQLRD